MKSLIFLFLLILLPLTVAADYNTAKEATFFVNVSSSIIVSDPLEDLELRLNFFPKEFDSQTIVKQSISTYPSAESTYDNQELILQWSKPATVYAYSVATTVKRTNNMVKISAKVPYPEQYDDDLLKYTLPSEFIDVTPEIESVAEKVTLGEDDVYQIVYLLANWTQSSVEYDLTTLTAEAVQPASWVMKNRKGVCDEITNLFIALVRSRGIPARFVSGMVYSNAIGGFGPHGWAEVYIDGHWVPFDVTFGTFGWVDASHITFKNAVDSGEYTTQYQGRGKVSALSRAQLNISVDQISSIESEGIPVNLAATVLVNNVGSGSVIPLHIVIKNPYDFYFPATIVVTKASGIIGTNTKSVLLRPNEEQSIFWLLTTPSTLEERYLYTSTIAVESLTGGTAETTLNYSSAYQTISEEDANTLLEPLMATKEKEYLDTMDFTCKLNKEEYYPEDTATLQCTATGDYSGTTICWSRNCLSATTPVLTWTIPLKDKESQRLAIVAENNEKQKTRFVDLRVLPIPELNIENLEPTTLSFYEEKNMSFTLTTTSPIKDIKLQIYPYGTLTIDTLDNTVEIQFPIAGKLLAGKDLIFTAEYADDGGRSYTFARTFSLPINNIPWYYRFIIYLQHLWEKL